MDDAKTSVCWFCLLLIAPQPSIYYWNVLNKLMEWTIAEFAPLLMLRLSNDEWMLCACDKLAKLFIRLLVCASFIVWALRRQETERRKNAHLHFDRCNSSLMGNNWEEIHYVEEYVFGIINKSKNCVRR